MKILEVWPDCDFLNGRWEHEKAPVDSFWVECTLEEVERCVLPFHPFTLGSGSGDGILLDMNEARRLAAHYAPERHPPALHFLISRDLQSVQVYPEVVVFSGLWNSGYPFVDVSPPIVINDLHELTDLKVERVKKQITVIRVSKQ